MSRPEPERFDAIGGAFSNIFSFIQVRLTECKNAPLFHTKLSANCGATAQPSSDTANRDEARARARAARERAWRQQLVHCRLIDTRLEFTEMGEQVQPSTALS